MASNAIDAQVAVNINIGLPPVVVPVVHTQSDYYYLPDIESYYDIRQSKFIYFGNGHWIYSRSLPAHYRNYNLHTGYKVVLTDYHGRTPYHYFNTHKNKYHKEHKVKYKKNKGSKHHKHHHDHYENDHDCD